MCQSFPSPELLAGWALGHEEQVALILLDRI